MITAHKKIQRIYRQNGIMIPVQKFRQWLQPCLNLLSFSSPVCIPKAVWAIYSEDV